MSSFTNPYSWSHSIDMLMLVIRTGLLIELPGELCKKARGMWYVTEPSTCTLEITFQQVSSLFDAKDSIN